MLTPSVLDKAIIKMLKVCDIIYFETKNEIRLFNKITGTNISRWMPNSRPRPEFFTDALIDFKIDNLFKLVFLGNVIRDKGIIEILTSVKGMETVKVEIYGPCHDQYILDAIKATTNCFYKGSVSSENVATIIKSSSALCLPSYYSGEGYPGVIIEAFSVGVPVISTSWNSIPEIVKHEVNGLLVEPKNTHSLTDAIKRLVADKYLHERLTINANASFSEFDSEKVHRKFIQDHVRLYES